MSALKKIADWLDPGRKDADAYAYAAEHANETVNDLVAKLASSANTTIVLRKQIKALRGHLMMARSYVIDASDQLEDDLAALPVRSKKRAPTEATLAAVNQDLKQIADVLADTGMIGEQPEPPKVAA